MEFFYKYIPEDQRVGRVHKNNASGDRRYAVSILLKYLSE